MFLLACEIRKLAITIKMNFESLATRIVASQQLLFDVGIACRRHERRNPIERAERFIGNRARLNLARPANEARHAESALPIGVLLTAERGRASIGPGILVRTIV